MQGDSAERDRREQVEGIRLAAAEGVRAALRRHMLLGESVVVADDSGGVRWLGPDDAPLLVIRSVIGRRLHLHISTDTGKARLAAEPHRRC